MKLTETTQHILGHLLVNAVLPHSHKMEGPFTPKDLSNTLTRLGKDDPASFKETITKLKQVGDRVATWEGLSVGLDDLESPPEKNKFINNLDRQMQRLKDPQAQLKLLTQGQQEAAEISKKHKGTLGLMVSSGSRGKALQLAKGVISPVISTGKDGPHNFLHKTSYAEGLTPGSWWNAAHEARQNELMTRLSITVPGDLSKVISNSMMHLVCSEIDCGTNNGVWMDVNTDHPLDRFTAQTPDQPKNKLIDTNFLRDLRRRNVKRILVRSPTTCEATDNTLCAKCFGLLSNGHEPTVGSNLGIRSAHAIAEPLTQKALDKKHAVATVGEYQGTELTGLEGFKKLTEIPKNFNNKAILSNHSGIVTTIARAPQGGNWVTIGQKRYYVEPQKRVLVRIGQKVEQGDVLSTGDMNPAEVMELKGIGQGREYFINMLQANYEAGGSKDFDRRHFENLAKATMNFVRITDPQGHPFHVGEIVEYNRFIPFLQRDTEEIDVDEAVGQILAKDYYNIKTGTMLLPSTVRQLKDFHVDKVKVARHPPKFKFYMNSIRTAPLHLSNFMGKLGHNHLIKTIKDAASYDQKSEFRSYNPTAAYIKGEDFGMGEKGKY